MKKINIKIISSVVAIAMMASVLTACSKGESANNRETTIADETQNTVNPSASEPNQSIASDALITETTTESTTETRNGYTYTINGVEYTISHPIEDYVYTLSGSDSKYIDLDGFMGAYGLHESEGESCREFRHVYKNDDFVLTFDSTSFSVYAETGICKEVGFRYLSSSSSRGVVGGISLSPDYPLDVEEGVFGVNGVSSDGVIYVRYSLAKEMLVAVAVSLDAYNTYGSTASAVDSLARSIYDKDVVDGEHGLRIQ